MIGKRLINTGVAAADALVPSENFNTVLYTGNGSTQRIGGYINRGAEFNGSSSTIDTGYKPATGSGEFSVSCFVLQSASSADGIWSTYTNTGTDRQGIGLVVSSSGIVKVNAFDAQGEVTISSNNPSTINEDTWYHMVVTYNAGLIKFYIDSVEQSATMNQSITAHYAGIHIGNYYASSNTSNMWQGKIDQFRIFNKALSQSEIDTLYGETHASTTISTTDIFSDNSGVALYQLDGNANDTGGVSGKFGSAAHFNGSSSKIVNSNFASLSQVGISMWVNIADVTSNYTLIGRYGTNREFAIYNYQTTNGFIANLYYNGNNGNAITITAGDYLTNNTWHHIAYTADGSTQPKLYIDGVQRGTAQSNNNTYYTTTESLDIGGSTGLNRYLNGKIDDVRIYSDALSSTEVGYLYNNTTASIPTDNLVAYYKLDGDARDEQQLYDGVATNVTYAYDGTATNVTYQEATKFQPDLVWIKNRSSVYSHCLVDSVRGVSSTLFTDGTYTQDTTSGLYLSSFDSNGFTVGTGNAVSANSNNIVAWCFKGGGTAVSNTDGTITSSVSANQDAGFSIVSYAGNNGSSATIGHGLNSAPELVIIKARNLAAGWPTLAAPNGTIVYTRRLNDTGATDSSLGSVFFNSTAPTSSVFTVGGSDEVNDGYNYIAYCFHSVDGYSKIGSYTGTGAAGNTIETGFEPAFLLIKNTSSAGNEWNIIDNKRDTENSRDVTLWANSSDTEATASQSGIYDVNFLSNGFSLENIYYPFNASGQTYIYLAIAADPDTTTPTVENSFDVVTYTGNGSADHKINTDFKPDFVWIKDRGVSGANHVLSDSVRGAGKFVISNLTDSEYTSAGGTLSSFDEDGFTLAAASPAYDFNVNGNSYVAWCWKAGDHDDNLPQINTEGSIDSVVSVNAEAGFSIVKYRGTASVGATVGHGLSSTPELYIIKETSAADDWMVVAKIGSSYQRSKLQTTDAFSTAMSGVTNNVDPTSTVITLGNSGSVNQSGQDYIGYFFHSVSGYQKIGSYTGQTGSVSVTTGFQPRFVLIKKTNTSTNGDWSIFDSNRMTSTTEGQLLPNRNYAESTRTGLIDFDSNGFTINNNTVGQINTNGDSYIYLAIK